MNKLGLWILVAALFSSPSAVLAADPAGRGIVKGTITIGGKPATDAVVSIEGLSKEQAKEQASFVKAKKQTINQKNLKFIPTVIAIMTGATVDFPNNDKSWHNVYSKGGANDFDLGLYAPGKTRSKQFDKAGVSRILCNAHPDMEAFVVVKDHPFFLRRIAAAIMRLKMYPWVRCGSRFGIQISMSGATTSKSSATARCLHSTSI